MIETALQALGATNWIISNESIYENIQWKDNIVLFTKEQVETKILELNNVKKPREIDARRLRLALFQLGFLALVESTIDSLDEAAIINWKYATTIKEDYPLVQALTNYLALDIDAIFDLAETIT